MSESVEAVAARLAEFIGNFSLTAGGEFPSQTEEMKRKPPKNLLLAACEKRVRKLAPEEQREFDRLLRKMTGDEA